MGEAVQNTKQENGQIKAITFTVPNDAGYIQQADAFKSTLEAQYPNAKGNINYTVNDAGDNNVSASATGTGQQNLKVK